MTSEKLARALDAVVKAKESFDAARAKVAEADVAREEAKKDADAALTALRDARDKVDQAVREATGVGPTISV